jgi:hypothetical protein
MSVRDVPKTNPQWAPTGAGAAVGIPWWSSIPGEGQGSQDVSHSPMARVTRGWRTVQSFPSLAPRDGWIRRGIARYLGPDEHPIFATRRHAVVLHSAVAVWFAALGLGVAAGLASRANRGFYLGQAGAAISLAGTVFLGLRAWQWGVARYVLTNDRVLLIEGILSRRVHGLPLRSVLDTTYRRTLNGRFLGYGDLELNLSGQPGLRKLTFLPEVDTFYHLILSLTCVRDVMEPTLLRSRSTPIPAEQALTTPSGRRA